MNPRIRKKAGVDGIHWSQVRSTSGHWRGLQGSDRSSKSVSLCWHYFHDVFLPASVLIGSLLFRFSRTEATSPFAICVSLMALSCSLELWCVIPSLVVWAFRGRDRGSMSLRAQSHACFIARTECVWQKGSVASLTSFFPLIFL